MKILPQGVTGFDSPRNIRPWSSIRKPIIQAIYDSKASIIAEFPCDTAAEPNYHFIQTSVVSILVHESFPFLAFTSSTDVPYLEIDFCEWPSFNQSILDITGWKILPIDFLNLPITEQITENLSSTEHNQIRYWKPKKIGDLIFNNWD